MNQEFIGALKEIVKDKGISEDLLFETIEDALFCIACIFWEHKFGCVDLVYHLLPLCEQAPYFYYSR